MKIWQAGIVVVAASGNTGSDPMTVGVPGNVPYIITVGAADNANNNVAFFSSSGPTVEGFVKPDILAPGTGLQGLMSHSVKLATDHPS
jgi:serine protease AprX